MNGLHRAWTWFGGALATSAGYVIAHQAQVGTVAHVVATAYPQAAPVLGVLGVVLAMAGNAAHASAPAAP